MARESYEVTLKVSVTAASDKQHESEIQRGNWAKDGAAILAAFVDEFVGEKYRATGGGFEIVSSTAHPTTVVAA